MVPGVAAVALVMGAGLIAGPAAAEAPGVFYDCVNAMPQPSSVELTCFRVDARAEGLRWSGNTAWGWFTFTGYRASGTYRVALKARFTFGRVLQADPVAYTTLTVRLSGNKRARKGQPKTLRYVLTCDPGEGWLPRRVARPCGA